MFMRTTAHANTALPWEDRPGHASRDRIGDFQLDATAVARFDQLLHEIHPEARHVDADRIATLARWLQGLPTERARAVLERERGRGRPLEWQAPGRELEERHPARVDV